MESSIEVKKIDITELNVDAIVNAANSRLQKVAVCAEQYFERQGEMNLQMPALRLVDVKPAMLSSLRDSIFRQDMSFMRSALFGRGATAVKLNCCMMHIRTP